jgi:glycosyltransferase involved in cell wall biosynthesis
VQAVWTVSNFNAGELRAAGMAEVKVFPLLYAPKPAALAPDPRVLVQASATLKTILFVGRLAPNKRVEDLIRAFAWYHRAINPFSRLLIVGSPRSAPRYFTMLRLLAGDLDLPNVCFEGFASPAGLEAYYRIADLYVSASEHEGYCLPLLEAMDRGVPVVARSTGGTPEAMGGGGVLYEDLPPEELAALLHRILSDAGMRAEILRSQAERMRQVRERPVEAELRALLAGFGLG